MIEKNFYAFASFKDFVSMIFLQLNTVTVAKAGHSATTGAQQERAVSELGSGLAAPLWRCRANPH